MSTPPPAPSRATVGAGTAPVPSPTGTARWFLARIRPHRPALLAAFVLMAIEGAMLGALSWSVGPLFDRIFVGGQRGALLPVGAAIMGLFILRALASLGQRVLMARVGQSVAARLQGDLLAHLLRLDSAFFTAHPPGTLIERVRGDSMAAAALPASVLAALGRDGVALISLLAVALSVDWVWTLIAVGAAPLLLLPAAALQRRVRRQARKTRAIAARLSTRLDEDFHGVNAIKLAGIEAREAARFEEELAAHVRTAVKTEAAQGGIPALMDVLAGIGFFGVLAYGGAQIIEGTRSLGDFMSFFTAMALVFEPLRRLGNVSGSWAAAEASLNRIRELFALQPSIRSPARPRRLPVPAARADIRFDDVHFAYGETPVLRGLNFTARAGETTALVGPSGAGKTTVLALLARLIEPQAGRITLGGVSIEELALDELRGLLSVVSQDSALFDESIRDNIALGAEVDAARLAAAARAAHVEEFAARLPRGLDTPAGPRGSALSGGQRQRVAIARALLRERPLLLLDEATSALDAASEAVVQEALTKLSGGRTTLVIAHRLSTVRAAQRIVVMDRGRAVEIGTHAELLAAGGLYAALYRMQFREE